jgi:winged helix DNA-binding protein
VGAEDLARGWSWRRQALDRSGQSVDDVLRRVCGVYSSQPSGPLSVRARMRGLEPADFSGPIERREAVRIPAMRTSIHVVPADLAGRFHAAAPKVRREWWLRQVGVSEEDFAEMRERISAVAREPMPSKAIREAVGVESKRFQPVLGQLCRDGVMMRATASSLRSNSLTYVAADAWLDGGLAEVEGREALAWLAGEYLRAFGPARMADFAWWSGAPAADAAEAVAAHPTVDVGDGLLLPKADRAEFEAGEARAKGVNLLPKWDCYAMGYASDGRARFVDPDVQPRAYEESGDGLPVVLVDGSVAGVWSHRFAGKRMEVRVEMFERAGKKVAAAVRGEVEEAAELLGAGSVDVDLE